jgi:ribosomal protein S12 methylthiotransferase accessory factor YcaO
MATILAQKPPGTGFKAYRRGTHRTVDPATTLARMQPHLASMGITRIANVTGLDRIGVPVVMVSRPNSRSLAVSQGKGLTLEAAKASGVMEAIELYHAERIELPLKLGSARCDHRSSP